MQGLLGDVFKYFGITLAVSLGVSAIVNVPELALTQVLIGRLAEVSLYELNRVVLWNTMSVLAVSMVFGTLASASITYTVVQAMRGKPVGLGAALRVGASRMWSVLGVAVIIVLLLIASCIPVALIGGMLVQGMGPFGFVVATPLLALPVVVAVRSSAAPSAAVVERIGPLAAVNRSWALCKGYGWPIFGVLLLTWILNYAVQWLIQRIFVGQPVSIDAYIGGMRASAVADYVVSLALTGLGAVIGAVVYQRSRETKEGVDVETLSAVFD